MKWTSMRTTFALSIGLAASLGCVADQGDASVLILYNKAPGAMCQIMGNDDGQGISRGIIDTRATSGYVFTPLIKNYARTTDSVSMETRLAFVEGADIQLTIHGEIFTPEEEAALAQANLFEFSNRFSAVVSPNGGTTSVAFDIVPGALLAEMRDKLAPIYGRALVEARVTIFGTLGGGPFESQEFAYWVEVCTDCLVNDLGSCSSLSGPVDDTGGTCNVLQDVSTVDCCTGPGGVLCPAVYTPSDPA